MKITAVNWRAVSVPQEPEIWAWGISYGRSSLILEVTTDEGITGIGEIVGFLSVAIVETILNQTKPVFIGQDPHEIEKIAMKFYGLAGWHLFKPLGNIVLAGMEMALWDILGKMADKPIHALLGGKVRDRVDYVYYMPKGEKKWLIERSKKVIRDGFKTLYVKVIDPDEAVSLLEDLRSEVGEEPRIRIDANEAWTVGTAVIQ